MLENFSKRPSYSVPWYRYIWTKILQFLYHKSTTLSYARVTAVSLVPLMTCFALGLLCGQILELESMMWKEDQSLVENLLHPFIGPPAPAPPVVHTVESVWAEWLEMKQKPSFYRFDQVLDEKFGYYDRESDKKEIRTRVMKAELGTWTFDKVKTKLERRLIDDGSTLPEVSTAEELLDVFDNHPDTYNFDLLKSLRMELKADMWYNLLQYVPHRPGHNGLQEQIYFMSSVGFHWDDFKEVEEMVHERAMKIKFLEWSEQEPQSGWLKVYLKDEFKEGDEDKELKTLASVRKAIANLSSFYKIQNIYKQIKTLLEKDYYKVLELGYSADSLSYDYDDSYGGRGYYDDEDYYGESANSVDDLVKARKVEARAALNSTENKNKYNKHLVKQIEIDLDAALVERSEALKKGVSLAAHNGVDRFDRMLLDLTHTLDEIRSAWDSQPALYKNLENLVKSRIEKSATGENTKVKFSKTLYTMVVNNQADMSRLKAMQEEAQRQHIHLIPFTAYPEMEDSTYGKSLAANFKGMVSLALGSGAFNSGAVLFTESDAGFIDNFSEQITKTIDDLPPTWELLHLCPGFLWNRGAFRNSEITEEDVKKGHLYPEDQGKTWVEGTNRTAQGRAFYPTWPGHNNADYGGWPGGPVAVLIKDKKAAQALLDRAFSVVDEVTRFDLVALDVMLYTLTIPGKHLAAASPQLCYEKAGDSVRESYEAPAEAPRPSEAVMI